MNGLDKLFKKGRDFLGVDYPIICGGMSWISTYELVRAVADAGGFGVFAVGHMPVDLFEKELDRCLANIKAPFAVNLITLSPLFDAYLDVLVRKDVKFIVFAGGLPSKNNIKKMKDCGKKVMAFAPNAIFAKRMIDTGVDALIIEGNEAGGHVGPVSTIVLLQEVLFEFRDFPVFVAGGVATGKMLAHMFLMGATGCQLGTIFVASTECTAHESYKQKFIKSKARDTVSSQSFDSRIMVPPVRTIKNSCTERFVEYQLKIINSLNSGEIEKNKAQEEIERYWLGGLRKAVVDGDLKQGSIMAGQSVGLIKEIRPVKTIIQELVADAEAELVRVKGLF